MDTKLAWMHKEYVRLEQETAAQELDAIEEAFKGWRYGFPSIDELLNIQEMELEGMSFAPITSTNPF